MHTTMPTTTNRERVCAAFADALFQDPELGLGVLDEDRRFVLANEVLGRLCGVPGGDVTGRSAYEMAWAQGGAAGDLLGDVARSGRPALHVEVPAGPGGSRHWDLSVYPVAVGDDVTGLGLVVVDVTERLVARTRTEHQVWAVYEHLVQSLSVAKMALELGGMTDAAGNAIDDALAGARRIVSSMVFAGADPCERGESNPQTPKGTRT